MTTTALRTRWRVVVDRYARFVEPRPDGLPNARVVGFPLGLLAVVLALLVGFGVTGSSTGIVHSEVETGADSALIAGEPQGIRSDEWFVQTSWVISQVEQGLPARNETFPGGMDATVQHDLPNTDWSTALRPHLWGFFVLPLDQAMAFKWWFPGFGIMAAGYLLAVIMMPRRPAAAAALGVGFFFSPFFQWWYLSTTLYPAVWAFLVIATALWCLRSERRRGSWVLAAVTAWSTAALAVGIYVPFIVPAVVVAAATVLGAVLSRDVSTAPLLARVRALVPLLVAGAVAGGVMVVWMLTRLPTIQAFLGTVYPGERLQQVGQATADQIAALFAGFLSFDLGRSRGAPFAVNPSEASTFLLPGLFLSVVLVWLTIERRRRAGSIDGMAVGALVAGALMLAYLVVPGWDAVAHLLFLDRTTYSRMTIGFGILSFVIVLLVVRAADERAARTSEGPSRVATVLALAAAIGSVVFVLWRIDRLMGWEAFVAGTPKRVLAAGLVLTGLFIFSVWAISRRRVALGALSLLVVSLIAGLGVNPLYRGVLDLRETATVEAVQAIDARSPGTWVGINTDLVPTMMLVESGVTALNGFQGAPPREMWAEIDPEGDEEEAWNRLGNLSWTLGEGEPDPRNPFPDQIQMTFDACSTFAQTHVDWVLSETPVESPCVDLVESIPQGPTEMRIYEVIDVG